MEEQSTASWIGYVEEATAGGFPLRYERVRTRFSSKLLMQIMSAMVGVSVVGCDQVGDAFPDKYYTVVGYTVGGILVLMLIFSALAKIKKELGFVDFEKETVRLLNTSKEVEREIPLASVSKITVPDIVNNARIRKPKEHAVAIGWNVFFDNGEKLSIQNMSEPVFSSRHKPFMVTLDRLEELVPELSIGPVKKTAKAKPARTDF